MSQALIILLFVAVTIAYLLLTHWVAMRAQRKGWSYNVFLFVPHTAQVVALITLGILGGNNIFRFVVVFATLVVALVILELLGDNSANKGDLVQTLQKTKLDNGTMMPRKYASKVLAVKIIDQTPVVQLDGPTGVVWIARENVQKI